MVAFSAGGRGGADGDGAGDEDGEEERGEGASPRQVEAAAEQIDEGAIGKYRTEASYPVGVLTGVCFCFRLPAAERRPAYWKNSFRAGR